jgi:hypothetical protein
VSASYLDDPDACRDCGGEKAPHSVSRCKKCLAVNRERERERRRRNKELGLCVVCEEPAEEGRTLCARHLRWYRERWQSIHWKARTE